jgi:hypothetical protein
MINLLYNSTSNHEEERRAGQPDEQRKFRAEE